MSTFEPRALPPDAYKGWLKNGGKILLRSWDVWLAVVFVVSCVANALALSTNVVMLVMVATSGVVHGLNAAAAERYARRERFGWLGLLACWAAEIRAFGPVLRRSLLVRSTVAITIVLIVLMQQHAHPAGAGDAAGVAAAASTDTDGESAPMWLLFFLPWNNVWFFALVFQRGGPVSMHYWLMTRCGVDAQTAGRLFVQAFRKNTGGFCRLTAVGVALMMVVTGLPFLTVLAECYWVSVLFCAWNEVFMGQGELEKQTAVQRAGAWRPRSA